MKNPSRGEVIKRVKEAGVVGAGGAGFPTHAKIDCTVDILIVNIAECEPLICKDKEIIRLFPQRVVHGAELVMQVTGAQQALFALKEKYSDIATLLKNHLKDGMSLAPLGDYYPAGDEVLLTYDVTGAVIPEGSLPLSKGILVSNAETLYNISLAMDSEPVIEKFLTIAGAVDTPVTVKVPIGVMLNDILHHFRIPLDDRVAFIDGVMMGTISDDPCTPIKKTTCGIVILPENHPVVRKRKRSTDQDIRIIKSACDQCSYCTEYCPRYLLGHRVEPHRIMRGLSLSREDSEYPDYATGCVECSLCTLFACPEALSPDIIMKEAKKQQEPKERERSRSIHPMREFRKVPAQRLIRRLSLDAFDRTAQFTTCTLKPRTVRVPITQYTGESLCSLKKEGERVSKGEQVALPEEQANGAAIHASITGIITKIEKDAITIERTA